MAYPVRGEPPIKQAAPIMATAMITLVVGGLAGIGFLQAVSGYNLPGLSWANRLLADHWFLMIYGFTVALVGMELLTLLSLEWSGRIAPGGVRLAFLALVWASIAAYTAGYSQPGLLLGSLALLLLTVYSWKTLMAPSMAGIPPGHYNQLLTLAPAVTAVVTLAYLALDLLGGAPFRLEAAAIVFIVLSIVAVLSRDVPLLLGVRPTRQLVEMRPRMARRAKIAYVLALAGILLAASKPPLPALGGPLLVAAAAASLASLGLPQALESSSKTIPEPIKRHLRRQVILAHTWLAIAGILATAYGLLGEKLEAASWGVWDTYIHAITLGFMFNIIMGVDAVLLYGHAGIPLSKTPIPTPTSSILLNTGLILRAIYGATQAMPLLAPLSGLMVGGAILHFYARNMRMIMKILGSK